MMFMIIITMLMGLLISMKDFFILFLFLMELLMLMLIYYLLVCFDLNDVLFMKLLLLSVCDGVIGLSLLVKFNFNYGHQNIKFVDL